jgi:hypothetical protein
MSRLLSASAAAFFLLVAGAARADQCQLVTKAQATKAEAVLKKSTEAVSWCKPCSEKAPGKPYSIKTIKVGTEKGAPAGLFGLWINGKMVDLAYTYVRKGPKEDFKNVAKEAGCKTKDVDPVIKASAAKY